MMAGGKIPTLNDVYQAYQRGYDDALATENVTELVRLRAENKEMADYLDVIEREVSYAYDAVTFGRFSKPNTAHEYVEEAVQERIEKAVEDAEEPLKDEIGGLRAENERLRTALTATQWSTGHGLYSCCPQCHGLEPPGSKYPSLDGSAGHSPDCPIAAALKEAP